MASKMEMRSKLERLSLLYVAIMLSFQNVGCVTIRNSTPTAFSCVANCRDEQVSEDCCGLYDRREVIQQWAGKIKPASFIPSPVSTLAGRCKRCSTAWISNQYGRCKTAKATVFGWIHSKKEEANAPPWPRFHPVPTKPVFEPSENDSSTAPETYGRFGRS